MSFPLQNFKKLTELELQLAGEEREREEHENSVLAGGEREERIRLVKGERGLRGPPGMTVRGPPGNFNKGMVHMIAM